MCLEISLKPYSPYEQAVKTGDQADLYKATPSSFCMNEPLSFQFIQRYRAVNVKINRIVLLLLK